MNKDNFYAFIMNEMGKGMWLEIIEMIDKGKKVESQKKLAELMDTFMGELNEMEKVQFQNKMKAYVEENMEEIVKSMREQGISEAELEELGK